MYYNKERKERYISEKRTTTILPEYHLEELFTSTSKYENELKKDICDFTVLEIVDFYKNINTSSERWLTFINSSLTQYVRWCIRKSLVSDFTNHFKEINHEMLHECVNVSILNESIITQDVLDDWMKILCNPCDKFVVEAIFEGIGGKELCELSDLRLSDFDFDNHTVTLHNDKGIRTINVSEKLCRLAIESANEVYYYPNNGECYGSGARVKYLYDPDLVLKNYPNVNSYVSSFQYGRRIKNKILRIARYTDSPYLTSKNLELSGKISFINSRCYELNLTGREYLYSDHIYELNEQFCHKTIRSTFSHAYEEYLVS